jgi:hypothetical protein
MKTIPIYIVFVVFLGFSSPIYAQETTESQPRLVQKTKLIDKFFFGGNIGLQFGYYSYVNISPVTGYRISERFNAGLGITYIYMSAGPNEAHLYGGKVFGQGMIWNGIFGHLEYEIINYPNILITGGLGRNNANAIFIGPGYQQNFGRRSFSQIMLLYNVIYDRNNSPYSTPFAFRVMFGF